MFKKPPEKTMGEPGKYIEIVGLNRVVDLATYLRSLQNVDPSVHYFSTAKKSEFQPYLDTAFESVISSKKKKIKEVTGDADFIKDKKRQKLYKKITDNDVRMEILMNIEPWTIQNAELLKKAGVDVRHNIVQKDYHFGTWADTMMFSLSRKPANDKATKIVSRPQKEEDVQYWFIATNQPNFVEYTNKLFDELKTRSISFEDQLARLNKNNTDEDFARLFA